MSEDKKNENEEEVLKTFDMYHFFSRKDVIMVMAFIIAFLIFALAILLKPQVA
ncbi:MAG: hypothetical protein AAF204_04440 [Pseudomonadota bacterium]